MEIEIVIKIFQILLMEKYESHADRRRKRERESR